jgi:multicomponent Na+:H+ antiporter subunit E
MHYVRTILILLAIYLALTGNLQPSNIVLGALVATSAALLLRPQPSRADVRRLPAAIWAILRYIAILAADVVKSGLAVARIVLDPALPIRPGIITIDSGCGSELGAALSAHALSITPGELVIGIDENGVMYTHCLDATHSAEYVAQAQEMRTHLLSKIFA